jgi:hypothetical protein
MDDKSKRNLAIFFLVLLFLVAVALLVVYLVKKHNDSKNSGSSNNKTRGRPAASRPAASRPAAKRPVSPPLPPSPSPSPPPAQPSKPTPTPPPSPAQPSPPPPPSRGRPSAANQTFINQFRKIGATGKSGLPLYGAYVALVLNSVDAIVDPTQTEIQGSPPSVADALSLPDGLSFADLAFAEDFGKYALAVYNYFKSGGAQNLKSQWAQSVDNLLSMVGCQGQSGTDLAKLVEDLGLAYATYQKDGIGLSAGMKLEKAGEEAIHFGSGVYDCYKNLTGSNEGYRYIQNNSCGCGC